MSSEIKEIVDDRKKEIKHAESEIKSVWKNHKWIIILILILAVVLIYYKMAEIKAWITKAKKGLESIGGKAISDAKSITAKAKSTAQSAATSATQALSNATSPSGSSQPTNPNSPDLGQNTPRPSTTAQPVASLTNPTHTIQQDLSPPVSTGNPNIPVAQSAGAMSYPYGIPQTLQVTTNFHGNVGATLVNATTAAGMWHVQSTDHLTALYQLPSGVTSSEVLSVQGKSWGTGGSLPNNVISVNEINYPLGIPKGA